MLHVCNMTAISTIAFSLIISLRVCCKVCSRVSWQRIRWKLLHTVSINAYFSWVYAIPKITIIKEVFGLIDELAINPPLKTTGLVEQLKTNMCRERLRAWVNAVSQRRWFSPTRPQTFWALMLMLWDILWSCSQLWAKQVAHFEQAFFWAPHYYIVI